MKPTADVIAAAQQRLAGQSAQDVLAWALDSFGSDLAIASSFSVED